MRSSELANLAGVTVRALRHYHKIGLLDEPERSLNGYRTYDVRHLVRLLRITRLTGLGVPLAVLPEVLDDPEATEVLLDELDKNAATEIERLQGRRKAIAGLRSNGMTPDLPPAMAAYLPVYTAIAEVDPELARYEREQFMLIGQVIGETALATFADYVARRFTFDPDSMTLLRRFASLGPDSTESTMAELADEMALHYQRTFDAPLGITMDRQLIPILTAHVEHVLNEQQVHTNRLMNERFVELARQQQAIRATS